MTGIKDDWMLNIDVPADDICRIIRHQAITTQFQPLISIKQRGVIGVEALSRGIPLSGGKLIGPEALFSAAEASHCVLALDRLCREVALCSFQPLFQHGTRLLFLNIDTSILDQGIGGSDYLWQQTQRAGIPPQAIVIEIIESRVRNLTNLQRFVETYRDYGFLIALDDVGSGHSNLDRIPLLKPDILKIDRSLISGIDQEYYKQVVVKSLVSLSESIGALVVAEGIEQEGEAITTLELGADLLQGFYFTHPQTQTDGKLLIERARVEEIANTYRSAMVARVQGIKRRHQHYQELIDAIVRELATVTEADFDKALTLLAAHNPALECLYVLDRTGIQVSETICNAHRPYRHANLIFQPARRGADHSLKEYYYLLLGTGIERYTTDPYISLATGHRCITIAVPFHDADRHQRILCVDIIPG